jgi:hypothetical protein
LKYGSASHWLARLDRDHHELAAQVRAGKLTANAAAIEAGFRKRTFAVPIGDAHAAARVIARHYDRAVIIAALNEQW